MSQIIKISKPGFNVLTETAPDNLIFSSDYNTLKYYVSGSVQLVINASGSGSFETSTTVAHNLGYRPFFFVEGRVNNGANHWPIPIGNHSTEFAEVYCDETNLFFYLRWGFTGAGSVDIDFYYKIFRNRTGL